MLNACLFFVLIKTLTTVPAFYIAGGKERSLLAFFCAAIWACYPTHSEAISWISARSDLIATAFYFSAMILFAKGLTGKSNVPTALVALPMVLGFLTKELTVSLPFVLFCLFFFSCKSPAPAAWRQSMKLAAAKTWPYFIVLIVYLIVRALALGDFVGGYIGSIGTALNASFVDRWFLSQSFFKIFHPFNDEIISKQDGLRTALRIIWGLCGVMCLVWARLGGAIAAKYRLMLFAFVWLFLTLAPNLQIWSFSETMAGGRIAYLPTAPIALHYFCSLSPWEPGFCKARSTLALKLAGYLTLTALIIVCTITCNINDRAWLEASNMVRVVRGQLNNLIDNLADGQKLVLLNLPTNIKGAYAFTSPGMPQTLLKSPLHAGDVTAKLIVLDAEPCSYPRVNFSDVKAAASKDNSQLFQLYYFDQSAGQLKKEADEEFFDLPSSAGSATPPACRVDFHDNEAGGENYRVRISPPVNPTHFEYARVTVTLSQKARVDKLDSPQGASRLCYVWNNCPADDTGDKEAFTGILIKLPAPGERAEYLLPLGQNKRWLLSKNVDCMQFFISGLTDSDSQIKIDFLPGPGLRPLFHGAVSGEGNGDRLLSLKQLTGHKSQILELDFDAEKMPGAKSVKIEMLPPYNYFEHFTRLKPGPDYIEKHLKLIDCKALKGKITLSASDFPSSAVFQLRACAAGAEDKILGDLSEPITVTVEK